MLKAEGVAYHYPGGADVLSEVSFSASAGEVLALVGRNGAGKSTLLRLLNGLRKPTRGSIVVDGMNTTDTPVHLISRVIGTVFQAPEQQIFNATVHDEVMFGPRNLPISAEERDRRVHEALARTKLAEFAKHHPLDLDQARRRFVALASVLATGPSALLLDEPQRGLDARSRSLLETIIRQEQQAGRCIIIVCHDMEFVARLATRVIALSEGRLSADMAPLQFFTNPALTAAASVEAPDIVRLSQALLLPPSLTPAAFAEAWLADRQETSTQV
ncbi:ABC transporter ATP-binding protein [Mesorhizobium sp. BAC0120]|uniref:energy-coupling factor ABC transporter ATP-binding protein n=1 Tax=Mesorhizobium sp. BAC0120 TaxID=3090670 RepID=UPI00298C1E0F|nr:ABC transporter ATP-binding protein [Mesorhizobium sp. BAC0120]MDW6023211.1 ABC transporter ATP-binding protein [Mesorhizobium sp. BAC0120]